jgi:hypothetical protein
MLAIAAGVALVVVAIVYFAVGANDLPSFFPGHSEKGTGTHPKRGIAALVVAAVCFAYAWTTVRSARRY